MVNFVTYKLKGSGYTEFDPPPKGILINGVEVSHDDAGDTSIQITYEFVEGETND